MIIQSINQNQFINAFKDSDTYKDNFSYNGLIALYDYLDQLSDSTEQDIELDIVAIACDYSECETAHDHAVNYFDYEGMIFDENGDETMTNDEVEASAIDYLENRTTVITFEGGVIINSNF